MHDRFTGWRKSSRSNSSGNCVEVGTAFDHTVGVRDTKQHGRGAVIAVSPGSWSRFLGGVRDGTFEKS